MAKYHTEVGKLPQISQCCGNNEESVSTAPSSLSCGETFTNKANYKYFKRLYLYLYILCININGIY